MKPTVFSSNNHCTFFLLLLSIAITVVPTITYAQGDLVLMPRRVVFEGAKKYEELNLANTGKDTARYAISMMHVRMHEDGSFEEISEPGAGENFADKYIRFFPHSVILGPGESQVVKIQLNRSNELIAGEYRSHLYFRAIPNETPLGQVVPTKDSSISIHLVPVFGISIPVIIHVGETNTQVSLAANSLEINNDTIPVLNMNFARTGNMSVYGDIAVEYISAQGKKIAAGSIKGVAVYTPNTSRTIKFNLEKNKAIDYHSGKLHISYMAPAESKKGLIAETDLALH